jgi:hypothetical protein
MWFARSISSTFIPSLIAILWNKCMFNDLNRIETVIFVRSGDAPSIFDEVPKVKFRVFLIRQVKLFDYWHPIRQVNHFRPSIV